MELRHLRYFVAVADEGHFGRASALLHVTQSTLSAQVQALEREVGGRLFTRTSRRVELTEAGELLLPEARRALAQAGRALQVARESVRGETGAVRIGFSGVAVLQGVLSEDLHAFGQAHPRVGLTLTELPPAAQIQQVRDGALDLGYCPDLGLGNTDGLRVTRRAPTPLSVVLRSDHELASASAVTIAALTAHDLIVFANSEEDETVLSRLWPALEEDRSRVRLVGSTLGVLALVLAGAGIAIAPTATERIALPGLSYRPLHGAPPGPDLLLIGRHEETSGAVRAYLALDRLW
ncbi:LysR family transcriptional regulator [Streptacidiphilus sp. PB12-B1b]|uniref:LysR family transcriptional regulator n=1 Tax=Streptacidiphilus sp. PB12-B1b TaxID=2705012 RepID=UPI0015FAEEBE|nr:LysR substrate-binding domain-containing protein [Streptacidiphilus sp. PB12-B1b]QMU77271.1 LysR family transcriptional regulator [Streptacidiphilus sp. PB12-B1b]